MTSLELLHDLNRRHARLELALSALRADLRDLQGRIESPEAITPVLPPPMPAFIPHLQEQATPPPLPIFPLNAPPLPPLPETPKPTPALAPAPEFARQTASVDGPGFELQFGRWLARIGVVFALFTLIFFGAFVEKDYYQYLGPWSKLTVLTLVSGGLIAAGLRLESRDRKLLVYGRTLAGGGLACLYYTLYGAIYVPQLQVISSPLLGGILLLAWSAGVLFIAEKRKSELLSVFAISLAYFSSAITPGNGFIMSADLILAVTAVTFLLRNAWTGLSYLCLVGTYAGFLRQAVVYEGPLDFQWIGRLPFLPSAVYLAGAWLIFTAGILLSRAPAFAAGKRMAFLCLNNGAFIGLLVLAAWLGGFHHMGGILGAVGGAFLGACALTRIMRPESRDLIGAYLSQGLALVTGGVAIAYSGVTRGLMITIESVFLVASGAFSRNLILRVGGGVTAFMGACYLATEIVVGNHFPWVLTFGGALAMLANAWLARREFWSEPLEKAKDRFVLSSAIYVLFGLGLLTIGVVSQAHDNGIAPDLALIALALTFAVYLVPVFELAPLSQILVVFAQAIAFAPSLSGSPASQGMNFASYAEPQWSMNVVALVTMVLVTWWPRQKLVRTGWWFQPVIIIYALAMVAYCYGTFRPHVTAQTWMMSAALLSLVFVGYGAWNRLWAFVLSGQILLALSVATFLSYAIDDSFAWTWWASAIPIAVVFATGWTLRELLPLYLGSSPSTSASLSVIARVYQSVAVGLLIRWVFGVAPAAEITLALAALGTAFIFGGLHLRSTFSVRSGFVISLAGAGHYLAAWPPCGKHAVYVAGRRGLCAPSRPAGPPAAVGARVDLERGKLGRRTWVGGDGLALRFQFRHRGGAAKPDPRLGALRGDADGPRLRRPRTPPAVVRPGDSRRRLRARRGPRFLALVRSLQGAHLLRPDGDLPRPELPLLQVRRSAEGVAVSEDRQSEPSSALPNYSPPLLVWYLCRGAIATGTMGLLHRLATVAALSHGNGMGLHLPCFGAGSEEPP